MVPAAAAWLRYNVCDPSPVEGCPGLREGAACEAVADWLDENPSAPLWGYGQEIVVAATRPDVNTLAVAAGLTPQERPNAYRATRNFGPVSYVVYAKSAKADFFDEESRKARNAFPDLSFSWRPWRLGG